MHTNQASEGSQMFRKSAPQTTTSSGDQSDFAFEHSRRHDSFPILKPSNAQQKAQRLVKCNAHTFGWAIS
jgi:hypothetical protein